MLEVLTNWCMVKIRIMLGQSCCNFRSENSLMIGSVFTNISVCIWAHPCVLPPWPHLQDSQGEHKGQPVSSKIFKRHEGCSNILGIEEPPVPVFFQKDSKNWELSQNNHLHLLQVGYNQKKPKVPASLMSLIAILVPSSSELSTFTLSNSMDFYKYAQHHSIAAAFVTWSH